MSLPPAETKIQSANAVEITNADFKFCDRDGFLAILASEITKTGAQLMCYRPSEDGTPHFLIERHGVAVDAWLNPITYLSMPNGTIELTIGYHSDDEYSVGSSKVRIHIGAGVGFQEVLDKDFEEKSSRIPEYIWDDPPTTEDVLTNDDHAAYMGTTDGSPE